MHNIIQHNLSNMQKVDFSYVLSNFDITEHDDIAAFYNTTRWLHDHGLQVMYGMRLYVSESIASILCDATREKRTEYESIFREIGVCAKVDAYPHNILEVSFVFDDIQYYRVLRRRHDAFVVRLQAALHDVFDVHINNSDIRAFTNRVFDAEFESARVHDTGVCECIVNNITIFSKYISPYVKQTYYNFTLPVLLYYDIDGYSSNDEECPCYVIVDKDGCGAHKYFPLCDIAMYNDTCDAICFLQKYLDSDNTTTTTTHILSNTPCTASRVNKYFFINHILTPIATGYSTGHAALWQSEKVLKYCYDAYDEYYADYDLSKPISNNSNSQNTQNTVGCVRDVVVDIIITMEGNKFAFMSNVCKYMRTMHGDDYCVDDIRCASALEDDILQCCSCISKVMFIYNRGQHVIRAIMRTTGDCLLTMCADVCLYNIHGILTKKYGYTIYDMHVDYDNIILLQDLMDALLQDVPTQCCVDTDKYFGEGRWLTLQKYSDLNKLFFI